MTLSMSDLSWPVDIFGGGQMGIEEGDPAQVLSIKKGVVPNRDVNVTAPNKLDLPALTGFISDARFFHRSSRISSPPPNQTNSSK